MAKSCDIDRKIIYFVQKNKKVWMARNQKGN